MVKFTTEGAVFGRSGISLKSTANETLFRELALRCYDLSKLRENDTEKGEIVKMG